MRMLVVVLVTVGSALADERWTSNADSKSQLEDDGRPDEYPTESGMDPIQNHPNYAHFFNGSYEVYDVLKELLSNKSLTSASIKR